MDNRSENMYIMDHGMDVMEELYNRKNKSDGEKEQTSADKFSALCDELRDYVLSKHNITSLKEIGEVCDMCHGLKKFLLVKNKRYGDSALKPVRVFSKASSMEQLNVRMDDKISRIMNSPEDRKNDFVDLMGYLVLKCVSEGWFDFSELLD